MGSVDRLSGNAKLLAEAAAIKVFDCGGAIPESDEGASGRVVVS